MHQCAVHPLSPAPASSFSSSAALRDQGLGVRALHDYYGMGIQQRVYGRADVSTFASRTRSARNPKNHENTWNEVFVCFAPTSPS